MNAQELQLWNTRTGKRECFIPGNPDDVGMYVCGPTVYDRAHIGNARPAVVFDVLFRLLRHRYGDAAVTYVRNITDIDDKINARALSEREAGDQRSLVEIVRSVTSETTAWYHQDLAALNVLTPTHEPRATDHISGMIDMITRLLDAGHAYEVEGHVLFRVDSYPAYGSLARRDIDDMVAGARVEVAPFKHDPMDFVLWKPSTADLPGWDGPWGRGRPGWHIECSAMSLELLGTEFDIHGGGIDLAFPHHENECAQSACANPGSGFARYWMHNGMITVEGRKMSKSLGNFITVRDLLDKRISGDQIRLVMLGTHYRQSLDWTARRLEEARSVLNRWSRMTEGLDCSTSDIDDDVIRHLAEDLNTPAAIARLHELASSGEGGTLKASAGFLGLLSGSGAGQDKVPERAGELVEMLLARRAAARSSNEYDLADQLRDGLGDAGVDIMDGREGSTWNASGRLDCELLEQLAECLLES